MKKYHIILMFLFLLLAGVLSAQTIVKIEKTDSTTMNLLESMKLNLCFEMNDYIVVSPTKIEDLNKNNINYTILTTDNISSPLYIVSVDKRQTLKKTNYIGEIVLDEDIRIERLHYIDNDLSPSQGVKYIPVTISQNFYKNISSEYIMTSIPERNDSINEIIQSVNADSIHWFIQNLEDFGTRYAIHPNRKTVAQWIADQFIRFGYTDVYLDSFFVGSYYQTWQYNVICEFPGTNYADNFVIVGGHHDSINQLGFDASLISAPGADDNASGVAVVLETARIMKQHNYQPKSSIRFITFAMEEFGLYGAYHDAQSVVSQGLNVTAMINSDMIANQPGTNWTYSIRNYPGADFLTNLALDYGQEYDMNFVTSSQYIANSDSWAYHNQGIPAIFFSEYEFSPYYHSDNDLLINLNMPYAEQFIKLIASVVISVSDMPGKPSNYTLSDTGTGTSLFAQWDEISLEGVDYKLTVIDLTDNSQQEYFTNQTSFEIPGLTTGNNYSVILYSHFEGMFSAGQSRVMSPLVIPRKVSNINFEPEYLQISFNWEPNIEMDIAGYKIYRKITNHEDFQLLDTVTQSSTNFIDATTENTIWYDYAISAFDLDGHESDLSEVITTRHISLNSGILVLDLTYNADSSVLYPPKELVDQFYRNITAGYDIDEIEISPQAELRIEDFGIYSTIIIHKNSFNTVANSSLENIIRTYLNHGGNLIYTANDPMFFMQLVTNSYPQSFTAGSLVFDYFNISSVNNNNTARFYQGISSEWNNIPSLTVDPEKTLASMDNKLFKIEAFTVNLNNIPPNFEVLYLYDSGSDNPNQAIFDSYPVAIYNQVNNSQVVLTSIPLYFIMENQAYSFMQAVLDVFNEETSVNDINQGIKPLSLNLRNYPNPFNPTTTIQFNMPKEGYAQVKIYNIKGQIAKDFGLQNYLQGEHKIVWNGLNDKGNQLSSGIYFYKINTDSGLQQINKMILLK